MSGRESGAIRWCTGSAEEGGKKEQRRDATTYDDDTTEEEKKSKLELRVSFQAERWNLSTWITASSHLAGAVDGWSLKASRLLINY